MAIAERIRYFRIRHGMTLKYLGMALGFPERSSDIRIAQYENGSREPKEQLTEDMAKVFGISPKALTVPDIDTDIGLMHTLFTLEDTRGISVCEIDGENYIKFRKPSDASSVGMFDMIDAWRREAQKLERGEITRDEYDDWRYTFPRTEAERDRARISLLRKKGE